MAANNGGKSDWNDHKWSVHPQRHVAGFADKLKLIHFFTCKSRSISQGTEAGYVGPLSWPWPRALGITS